MLSCHFCFIYSVLFPSLDPLCWSNHSETKSFIPQLRIRKKGYIANHTKKNNGTSTHKRLNKRELNY